MRLARAGPGAARPAFPWRRRLAFATLTTVFILGLVELGLRLLGPPPAPEELGSPYLGGGAMPDPDYGWRLVPGSRVADPVRADWERRYGPRGSAEADQVNRHSFRDSPLAEPRPPAQRRVLVLGDSSVYGSGVPAELRFSERVQAALVGAGPDTPEDRAVEVINGGVPGWSSSQSLQQLRDSLHLGLDAVVVYNMLSDQMASEGGVPDHRYFAARRRLRGGDGVLRLSTTRWLTWLLSPVVRAPGGAAWELRVPLPAYLDNLREIAAITRAQGMGLVFMLPGTAIDLQGPGPASIPSGEAAVARLEEELALAGHPGAPVRQGYRTAMALAAREAGAPLVDGPALFNAAMRARPEAYTGGEALFVDAVHPSVTGHALLAEALQPELLRVLTATRPWSERQADLRRTPRPAWLDQPSQVDPALAQPPPRGADPVLVRPAGPAPTQVPCGAQAATTGADEVALALEIDGVEPGQAVRVGLVQPGVQDAPLRLQATCTGPRATLVVPRATGEVRVVAAVDLDGDGPCRRDRAAAGRATLDLAQGQPSLQEMSLQAPSDLGPWAPPWGLPHGLHPLFTELERRYPQGGVALDGQVGLALVVDPAADGLLDTVRALQGVGDVTTETQPTLRFGLALDRPETPLSAYDGLVVVAPLGADLAPRAAAALGPDARIAAGWTDPAGLAWSLVLPAQAPARAFEARVAGQRLLDPAEGLLRAARGEGPALPPELSPR